MIKPPIGLVATLATVMLVGSGCGSISVSAVAAKGSVDSATSSAATSTAATSTGGPLFPSPSPTPTPASSPAAAPRSTVASLDKARLAALSLVTSDLPAGWTRHVYHDVPSSSSAGGSSCIGRDTTPDILAEVDSPGFWHGAEATIDFDAVLFRSPLDVKTDSASLLDPRNTHCDAKDIGAEVVSEGPPGSKLISVTSTVTHRTSRQPANLVANETSVVHVSTPTGPITAYLESAYLRGATVEVELDFFNLQTPIPSALQKSVVARMAARAAKA